jgi:hypothetical protein
MSFIFSFLDAYPCTEKKKINSREKKKRKGGRKRDEAR